MMLRHSVLAIVALFTLTVGATSSVRADDQLVPQLKRLGKGVDDMAANISQAESDAVAQQLAQVTQQTFASQMTGDPQPVVTITASRGKCYVLITTPQWKLWSRAENGRVVDHGATIN